MRVYYNEWDRFAAAWLRELMADGLIPAGDIDTRSITEVQPDDLIGYDQCHFFAGIGGWPLALQLAGWPADRPVWSGSCPCQPFSTAGKGKGEEDERHLWPELRRLIAERRPATVVGEQVASRRGRGWLAGVRTDLEALGYAVGSADLCAAGVQAPHIRQRLYWVADADIRRLEGSEAESGAGHDVGREGGGGVSGVADSDDSGRCAGYGEAGGTRREVGVRTGAVPRDSGTDGGWLGDTNHPRPQGLGGPVKLDDAEGRSIQERHLGTTNLWSDSQWIECRDGKLRRVPVESEVFPLAYGIPNRVGTLRGSGNAIVPEVGAAFLKAYLQVTNAPSA